MHYRARAYDPALGRFLQVDPILFGGGMNLYAYVGNDPVNAIDPLGLQASTTPIDEIVVPGFRPGLTDTHDIARFIARSDAYRDFRACAILPFNCEGEYGELYDISDEGYGEEEGSEQETGRCSPGIVLFNRNDLWGMPSSYPYLAANPFPGSFLVSGHGNRAGVFDQEYNRINPGALANIIRDDPSYIEGQEVTIAACNVGYNRELLQGLANRLGACIRAPLGNARFQGSRTIRSIDRATGREQPWARACPSSRPQ